jgi:hypothetical protein
LLPVIQCLNSEAGSQQGRGPGEVAFVGP